MHHENNYNNNNRTGNNNNNNNNNINNNNNDDVDEHSKRFISGKALSTIGWAMGSSEACCDHPTADIYCTEVCLSFSK